MGDSGSSPVTEPAVINMLLSFPWEHSLQKAWKINGVWFNSSDSQGTCLVNQVPKPSPFGSGQGKTCSCKVQCSLNCFIFF